MEAIKNVIDEINADRELVVTINKFKNFREPLPEIENDPKDEPILPKPRVSLTARLVSNVRLLSTKPSVLPLEVGIRPPTLQIPAPETIILNGDTVVFTFEKILGAGSFGTSLKATMFNSTKNEIKNVVIKILHSSNNIRAGAIDIFNESAYLQLFSRNRIICNRYCACLQYIYTHGKAVRLVYDYVPGPTLYSILRFPGTYTSEYNLLTRRIEPGFHLIKGLDYLHRLGVYHLDIKSGNILFDTINNLPKYIDWGSPCAAKLLFSLFPGDLQKMKGMTIPPLDNMNILEKNKCMFMGTEFYTTPEIIAIYDRKITRINLNAQELGAAHDIWSLGVTLFDIYSAQNIDYKTYIFSPKFYTKSQREIDDFIDSYIQIENVFNRIIKNLLTIDPRQRIDNWKVCVKFVNEFCKRNPANDACLSENEHKDVNKFILDTKATAYQEAYDNNLIFNENYHEIKYNVTNIGLGSGHVAPTFSDAIKILDPSSAAYSDKYPPRITVKLHRRTEDGKEIIKTISRQKALNLRINLMKIFSLKFLQDNILVSDLKKTMTTTQLFELCENICATSVKRVVDDLTASYNKIGENMNLLSKLHERLISQYNIQKQITEHFSKITPEMYSNLMNQGIEKTSQKFARYREIVMKSYAPIPEFSENLALDVYRIILNIKILVKLFEMLYEIIIYVRDNLIQ